MVLLNEANILAKNICLRPIANKYREGKGHWNFPIRVKWVKGLGLRVKG